MKYWNEKMKEKKERMVIKRKRCENKIGISARSQYISIYFYFRCGDLQIGYF